MSIYVLKDQDNNYVSETSIYFSNDLNKIVYSYSPYLTNGFYICPTKTQTLLVLGKLQILNDKYHLGKSFRLEEIDRYETLLAEHKLNVIKVGVSSIRHVYIDIVAAKSPCKISDRCIIERSKCPCPYKIA